MRRIWKVLIIVGVVVVVLFGGAYGLLVWRNRNAPPPPRLATVTPSPGATATSGGSADGTWTVKQDERTYVGYRVNEQLANVPVRNDAVGRTPAVTGTLRINGAVVEAVDITADLRQLKSDQANRDNSIRTAGLETERFPEATFVLSAPITQPGPPAENQPVTARAAGKLTIHGITQDVEIDLQGRWSGATVEVVGSLPIVFADYGITPPRLGPVIEIEDRGTMELSLVFQRG